MPITDVVDLIGEQGHKLLLTSCMVFLPNELQLPFAMVCICAYTSTILALQPYLRKVRSPVRGPGSNPAYAKSFCLLFHESCWCRAQADDRLHLLAQSELFLLAQAGYILLRLDTIKLDQPTVSACLRARVRACLIAHASRGCSCALPCQSSLTVQCNRPTQDIVLSACLIVLTIGVMVTFVVMAARTVKKSLFDKRCATH